MSTETSTEISAPAVLLVIPALNEAHGIADVIERLFEDPPDCGLAIVVADGGSKDGTVEIVQQIAAREPRLHLMHNPHRIQSAAVNLAVLRHGEAAQVLVRCDAHAAYPPSFVRRLLQTLETTGADAVVVPMDTHGEGCLQKAVAWVSNSFVGTGGSAHRGGRRSGWVDHGHHAAFRMASFRHAGGYDESFTHNEDAEFDCRQRGLGARIYLDADIRLGYVPRATLPRLARQYFAYGGGRSRTARRHPGSLRARQLALPVHLGLLLASFVLALWQPVFLAWPVAYLVGLCLTSFAMAFKYRSICGLLAGPAAGTMHLSWASGFVMGLLRHRERAWQPMSLPEVLAQER